MRFLILLLSLYVAVRAQGQLNAVCSSDTDCTNGVYPCTLSNCICDTTLIRCRLATGQSCTNGYTTQCHTGTICSNSRCVVSNGNNCSADSDCLTHGVCVSGSCRADTGYAWNVVTSAYEACSADCATCYLPADNTTCLTCTDTAKYAYGGLCICSVGAPDSYGTCQSCDTTCSTCAVPLSPFGCTACAVTSMNLISGICFCPSGTAWNSVTLNCESCDTTCLTCSRPGNSAYCTSCSTGTPVNGVCGGSVTPCADGTAQGASGCEACDTSCRTCIEPGNSDRCSGCYTGYKLVGGICVSYTGHSHTYRCKRCPSSLMLEMGGVCKCRQGYVGDSVSASVSDTYCLPCDSSCLTCYAPNNNNACTSCCSGYTTTNGTCAPTGSSSNQNPITNCASECATCIVSNDATECLTCNVAGAVQLNGVCYCPSNYFSTGGSCVTPCESPCTECYMNNPYICTACPSGMLALGGTCLCPNGTALDSSGNCVGCDISCISCAGGLNSNTCLNCRDTRITPVNGQCVCPDIMVINNSTGICACPSGYVEQNMACILGACGPGTYFNGSECLACNVVGCLNCSSATTCAECQAGYYLNSNSLCTTCPTNCPTCSSATVCTSCGTGFVLNSAGRCVKACPACCPTCRYDSSGQVTCLTCLAGTVYRSGQCMSCSAGIPNCLNCANCGCARCKAGYYKSTTGLCLSCSSTIANCQLCNNARTCYRCVSPYYFNVGLRRCVLRSVIDQPTNTTCPEGTYMDRYGVCRQCHNTCRCCAASGNYACTRCHSHAVYRRWGSGGMCVCVTGYYFDSVRRGCYQRSTLPRP